MKRNLFNIFYELHSYLEAHKIEFTCDGYPIFSEKFILREVPTEILPFEHRNAAKDKSKTVICFFANDNLLYRRLMQLKKDLPIYKEFLGVCGFDLSARIGWSIESQKFNICLSQMATIFLALNGVKIIPNFRIGELETLSSLSAYPKNIPFVVGTIGCSQNEVSEFEKYMFLSELFFTMPSVLFVYGKLKQAFKSIANDLSVSVKEITDFRTLCFSEIG